MSTEKSGKKPRGLERLKNLGYSQDDIGKMKDKHFAGSPLGRGETAQDAPPKWPQQKDEAQRVDADAAQKKRNGVHSGLEKVNSGAALTDQKQEPKSDAATQKEKADPAEKEKATATPSADVDSAAVGESGATDHQAPQWSGAFYEGAVAFYEKNKLDSVDKALEAFAGRDKKMFDAAAEKEKAGAAAEKEKAGAAAEKEKADAAEKEKADAAEKEKAGVAEKEKAGVAEKKADPAEKEKATATPSGDVDSAAVGESGATDHQAPQWSEAFYEGAVAFYEKNKLDSVDKALEAFAGRDKKMFDAAAEKEKADAAAEKEKADAAAEKEKEAAEKEKAEAAAEKEKAGAAAEKEKAEAAAEKEKADAAAEKEKADAAAEKEKADAAAEKEKEAAEKEKAEAAEKEKAGAAEKEKATGPSTPQTQVASPATESASSHGTPKRLPYNMQNVRGTGDLPDDGPVQSPVYEVLIVNAQFWQTVLSICRQSSYKSMTMSPTQQHPTVGNLAGETHCVGTHGSRRGSMSPLGDGVGGDSQHDASPHKNGSPNHGGAGSGAPLTLSNMDVLNREGHRGGAHEAHHNFVLHAMGTGTLSHAALATVLTEQGIPCSDVLAAALIRRVAGGRQRLTEQHFNLLISSVNAAVIRTIAATNLRSLGNNTSKYRGQTPTDVILAAQREGQTHQIPSPQQAASPQQHQIAQQQNTPRRSQSPTASSFSPSYRQSNLLTSQRVAEAPVYQPPIRGRQGDKPWQQPLVSESTALLGGKRRSTAPLAIQTRYYRNDGLGAANIKASGGTDLGSHDNLTRHHLNNIEFRKGKAGNPPASSSARMKCVPRGQDEKALSPINVPPTQ